MQSGGRVETIKNVTIEGVTQGIEILEGASVGHIENVYIKEASNGIKNGNNVIIGEIIFAEP